MRGVHLGVCGGLAEPLADFVDAAQPKDVECAVVKVLLGLVDDALAVVPPARSVGRLPCRHKLHSQATHEHNEERNNHLLILDMKETWPDSRPMCVPGMRPY